RTVDIARKFKARIIRTDNPPVFHINKQKAIDAARGAWILQLDADETVTAELGSEIRSVVSTGGGINGYYLPRKNYFWGRFMTKGGQYPDYVIRLVRRGQARFPAKSVHEQISVTGEAGYLKNPLIHYAYRTQGDYWRKARHYIALSAAEMKRQGIKTGPAAFVKYFLAEPLRIFFLIFFRHKGFMDGWRGFLFAVYSGLHPVLSFAEFLRSRI
ncbi:hypothetical protein A2Z33_05445, partial [Candidatus Gottesmanbacteria bacterium RBG_16_52_11]